MGTQLPSPKRRQRPQFSAHICCRQMAEWIKMPLGREVGLSPSGIVLDRDPVPPPQKGVEPPYFRSMSVVAKWLDGSRCHLVGRGRPQPKRHCVRWGPSSPSPKRGQNPPILVPCLLWPDGWRDQDATWHGGRSRPRPHCSRWGSCSSSPNGAQPPILAHICCNQMAGWIKMPLGREIGLSPSDIVLDGDPAPHLPKSGRAPNFRPISVVAKRLDASRCHLVWM